MGQPVVFLDRDGVINIDSPNYIKSPSEFHFIPNSPEAIAMLSGKGFKVILITNQSMIGRKMATNETLTAIFDKMNKGIQTAGGRIDDIFFCPHLPTHGCECRKPKPGLILQAAKKHTIDLSCSVMVGDSAKDIEAGQNAGCGKTVLVKTGNFKSALSQLKKKSISPDAVVDDLSAAVRWIIENISHP